MKRQRGEPLAFSNWALQMQNDDTTHQENLEEVLFWATFGIPVFPLWGVTSGACDCGVTNCKHTGKHPHKMAPNGHLNASLDPAVIREWWLRDPNANVGYDLVRSRVCIVAPDCPEVLEEFHRRGLTKTVCVQSGGGEGHEHHLFQLPDGCPQRRICRPSQFDIISNGYAVTSPSMHRSGTRYRRLVSPADLGIDHVSQLPPLPDWAVKMLLEAEAKAEAPDDEEPDDPNEPPVQLTDYGRALFDGSRTVKKPDGSVDRSATLFAIGLVLHRAGASRGLIVQTLAERDETLSYRVYTERSDAMRQYRNIARKVAKEKKKRQQRDRFTIHSTQELLEQPDPLWLVNGLLTQGGTAAIIGEPAAFKTFAAWDIAVCVARGKPYAGHRVAGCAVLYISGEGSGGLKKRLLALCKTQNLPPPDNLYTITEAANLLDATERTALLETIEGLGVTFGLIVLDTLARCMVGGDENSARDMGIAVDALTELAQEIGATVLVLHHTTKATGSIRGSTALPGGLDTIIKAVRDGDRLTLFCTKQKDAEEFEPHYFRAQPVELDSGQSSLVLIQTGPPTAGASATAERVLTILRDLAGDGEVTSKEWLLACKQQEISEAAFKRHKKSLLDEGKVTSRSEGRRVFFRIAVAKSKTKFEGMTDTPEEEEAA